VAAFAAIAASPREVRVKRFKNSRLRTAWRSNELKAEDAQTATAPPAGAFCSVSARLSV
jgi:hypothetical protein